MSKNFDLPIMFNIAILFWFYKEFDVCADRLCTIKKYNPGKKIYGLYGGEMQHADEVKNKLSEYLDDLFVFPLEKDKYWRWYNGDIMISHWFKCRGVHLEWDTVFLYQWDMILINSVDNEFKNLKKGEILLSGLRPVAEVSEWWHHLREGSDDRSKYDAFIQLVKQEYNFSGDPKCCLFVVACLPREFLLQYSEISSPELGFLEYKIPVYAQIFKINFCENHNAHVWWHNDPDEQEKSYANRVLIAHGQRIPLLAIEINKQRQNGMRIFHPVFRSYNINIIKKIRCIAEEFLEDIVESKVRYISWSLYRLMNGKQSK